MKAVVLEGVGGPDQLVVKDVPAAVPEKGQALIDVRAAGVNFLEVLVRTGRYPQPPELPWIPGLEVAGDLADRRVLGLVRQSGGGYAEQVAVDEQWLFDLPDNAGYEDGASFLMAFLTAWLPLTRQADVRTGVRVLVHAAAGGVGSAAVQVARVLGADVIATAGTQDKLELPLSLGAQQAVTYDRLEDVEPVDVVFDPIGGPLFLDSLRLLRPLGTALEIGFAGGLWPPVEPALLVGRNIGVQGFYLGRLMSLRPNVVRQAALDLLRLWESDLVRPVVGATFSLDEAGEAHRLIEERLSRGKVVLVP